MRGDDWLPRLSHPDLKNSLSRSFGIASKREAIERKGFIASSRSGGGRAPPDFDAPDVARQWAAAFGLQRLRDMTPLTQRQADFDQSGIDAGGLHGVSESLKAFRTSVLGTFAFVELTGVPDPWAVVGLPTERTASVPAYRPHFGWKWRPSV